MYEVQHYTICGGWLNTWSIITVDDKETPHIFATESEAQKELDEFFNDIETEIEFGERDPDNGFDREEFRIVRVK